MTTADKLLEVARRNLGVTERPMGSNRQPYAAIAGHADGYAWCDTFCVATAKVAKVKGVPDSAYCPASVQGYQSASRLFTTPARGDQGFIWYGSKGRYAHTGWVEAVEPGGRFVIMIEGNTDEAGGRTGGKVMRKRRSTKGMVFGRPLYAAAKPKAPTKRKPDPTIAIGAQGQLVLNIQRALVRHGHKVATDASFGALTKKAVIAFQRKMGLVPDGIVGQATWNALRSAR